MFNKLKFLEFFKPKDKPSISDKSNMRGRVIVKDLEGNTILQKDNLIVLRGRSYALELLFGASLPAGSGYIANNKRKVCLFKIGSGGADIQASPFQPFAPKFDDMDLSKPVPFIIVDPDKYGDPSKAANPSIVEKLSDSDKKKYYMPVSSPNGTTAYYGKIFEPDTSRWRFNKEGNEVYQFLTLRIEPNESRGFMINELGLVIAEEDKINNVYKDIELFSRVTFDTDSLTSLSKGIIIEYLVYA